MSDLCQTDYARVRPTDYFPETFRTGTCEACGEDTFVGRVNAREAREARWQADMDLPLAPERPDKLTGPELGARVRYVSHGSYNGRLGTVTARSYVWSPEKVVTLTDGSRHRGFRRYEDSVVRFDNGTSLSVLDKDLVEVTEPHAFSPGSPSWDQTPDQCYYCWEPAEVHDEEPSDRGTILRNSDLTTGDAITDNRLDSGPQARTGTAQ